jgi:cell division topological specificity factor
MFEGLTSFFKKVVKNNPKLEESSSLSKDAAKERLHLVLVQDRANVSADFLDLMKQEIIDVIKKYVDIDENEIDVRLTNQANDDGTNGAPALYANIPIINIKNGVIGEKMREQGSQMTIEDLVNNEGEETKEEVKEEPPKVIELGESKEKNIEKSTSSEENEKVDEIEEIKEKTTANKRKSKKDLSDEKKIEDSAEKVATEKESADDSNENVDNSEEIKDIVEEKETAKCENSEATEEKVEDKDVEELEKIEELIGENIDSVNEQLDSSVDENNPEKSVTHKKNRKRKTSKRK